MSKDSKDNSEDKKKPEELSDSNRRKTVRRMLVGGGVIAAGSQITNKWGRPVVDSVLIPAHAQATPGTLPTAPPTTLAPGATAAPTLAPTTSAPTVP